MNTRHIGFAMALLCTSAVFCATAKTGEPAKGAKMNSVTFSISLDKSSFLKGEAIEPLLQIVNTSKGSVTVPVPLDAASSQPLFKLKYPDGRLFTFDPSLNTHLKGTREPFIITLPTDMAWEGTLPLTMKVRLNQVGQYEFSAQLDWKGLSLTSNVSTFELLAPNYTDRAFERSLGINGGESYSAIGLQRTADKNIYFSYDFTKSVTAGLGIAHIGRIRWLPRNEIKLFNTVRQEDSLYFISGIQGDRVLVADLNSDIKPLWIEGAINVLAMLPAIVTYEGLNLFLVRKNAGSADLAFAFARPLDQPKADSALRTIATLPGGFVAADTAFELGSDKPRMVVASISNVGTNIQLQVLFADQKGSIKAKREYAVPGLAAVGPMAVSIGPKEEIRMGFVAHSPSSAKDMFLVDVRTEKGGFSGPMSTSTTPLHFDVPPTEIQIRYALDETGTPARALLARMADGQAFMIQEHLPMRKLSFTIPPDSTTSLVLEKNHNWNVAVFTQTGVQLNYVPRNDIPPD